MTELENDRFNRFVMKHKETILPVLCIGYFMGGIVSAFYGKAFLALEFGAITGMFSAYWFHEWFHKKEIK